MADGERVDLAAFASEKHDDAYVAMAESYAEVAAILNAVLAKVGAVKLSAAALARGREMVTLADPPLSGWELRAVPREESGVSVAEFERKAFRTKWEAQYGPIGRRGGRRG